MGDIDFDGASSTHVNDVGEETVQTVVQGVTLYNGLHRFFPYIVHMRGGRTVEVDVSHRSRELGTSKYSPLGRGIPAFLDLLMVRRMIRRSLRYTAKESQ